MLRAANTGISAVIDPRGRILDAIALNTAGYLDVALPAAGPPTLYARTGDAGYAFAYGGIAFALANSVLESHFVKLKYPTVIALIAAAAIVVLLLIVRGIRDEDDYRYERGLRLASAE